MKAWNHSLSRIQSAVIAKSYCPIAKSYWAVEGEAKFPELAEITRRVFNIPCSSAASERAWNVFSTIHTKKRNRLKTKTEEMLLFTYINMSLVDTEDSLDYNASSSEEELTAEI